MQGIIKRNLLRYKSEKINIFFSLLGPLLVLVVYMIFLKASMLDTITEAGLSESVLYIWIISGAICIATLTTPQIVIGYRIEDVEDGKIKDFLASPIKKHEISLGYIISSVLVGIITTTIILLITQVCLFILAEPLSLIALLKTIFVIIISVIMNASVLFFLSSFFKGTTAWSSFCTLTGTLIGFIVGMYIPLRILSDGLQTLFTTFPQTVSMGLFRVAMLKDIIDTEVSGNTQAIEAVNTSLSIQVQFMGQDTSFLIGTIILLIFTITFTILASLLVRKQK